MARFKNNIQDTLLHEAYKNKALVTIFTVNGVQIKGKILGYDSFTMLVETADKKQQMLYKHAISTIVSDVKVNMQKADAKKKQLVK